MTSDTRASAAELAALKQIPARRLKPVDGLAITAELWEEAHDFHRLSQRAHYALGHGYGILTGLEVIASDPPDSTIYIRPGAAVDAGGELIVLPQAVAYDLGAAQGELFILLSYAESDPRTDARGDSTRLYIQTGYEIEARPTLPDGPHIELARVRRQGHKLPVQNAVDPAHPGVNEIDLRVRRRMRSLARAAAGIAICYVGEPLLQDQAREGYQNGLDALARFVSCSSNVDFWVDQAAPLAAPLDRYALVYVVGLGRFQMSPDEMNGLYGYIQAGGTVLFEGCHRIGDGTAADAAIFDLLSSFGIQPAEVKVGHALLTTPWLFGAPPAGYDADAPGRLLAHEGVIASLADYGSVWQGWRQGRPATRDEIRSAQELGANILAYALRRRGW